MSDPELRRLNELASIVVYATDEGLQRSLAALRNLEVELGQELDRLAPFHNESRNYRRAVDALEALRGAIQELQEPQPETTPSNRRSADWRRASLAQERRWAMRRLLPGQPIRSA